MDPRLLTLESRKQFAKASNAARRYQAEALRTGEAELKNNVFTTRSWNPLFKAKMREDQDIGDTFGAALALDPGISSLLFSQNNLGIDDIAILQDIPNFYG